MRLRTRLALVLLACGLLPLLGAGAVARVALSRRFEAMDTQRRAAAVTRVSRTLHDRAEAQARSLSRFCAHDYLVDRALLQLETSQFTDQARAELTAVLPEVRDALGLDALALVRGDGEVLASAHYPGQAGLRDADTWRVASTPRDPGWARRVRVRGPSGPVDRLVLESACTRRRGAAALAVAGGEAVDDALLASLTGDDTVTARLAPADEVRRDDPAGLRRVLPLPGPDGAPVAAVVIETSDRALVALMADLDALTLASALLAALVAVALAAVFAPALARPIGVVADAADRIAAGDRTVHLDVTAGGEVGRLVVAFNRMTSELAAADTRLRRAVRVAAWRDIARQMAHEIKNPLTPIRMAVEMLRKARERQMPDFDEIFEEETLTVLEEVERLRRLVEDFSRFARAPKPRPDVLALPEVVAHVVELHAGAPVAVTWKVDGEAPFPLLRADRDQLTQVLVNLVANAVHAAAERAERDPSRGPGSVRVTLSRAGDGFARLTVEDDGGGIPAEVMERLFEPYVTTKKGGTGLGLAISYRIVTDHGGTLTADSSPAGTRFTARLPFAGPASLDTHTAPETGLS